MQLKREAKSDARPKVTITTPSYKDLYDGVHPSDPLSEKWFSFLCRSVESDLKECPGEPLSSSSSSESSAEDSDCDTQPDTCPTICKSSRTPRHWKLPSTIAQPNNPEKNIAYEVLTIINFQKKIKVTFLSCSKTDSSTVLWHVCYYC